MKTAAFLFALFLAALPPARGGQNGAGGETVGSQSLLLAAGSDTVVAPQFFPAPTGTFEVKAVSNAPGQATLSLAGTPPLDNYGAPLRENAFQYSPEAQPDTYYVLVLSGNLRGAVFTVDSNTPDTLTIALAGSPLANADIKKIELRPAWRLSSLFPPSQANITFVSSPNGNPDESGTAGITPTLLSVPDFAGTGTDRPPAGTYFFNDLVHDWVSTNAPSEPAGDLPLMPGHYVIAGNKGANSAPLRFYIAGNTLDKDLAFGLATLANAAQDTYLSLPRVSDFRLSDSGFKDSNFVQSLDQTPAGRRDELIALKSDGGTDAAYYKYKNRWYVSGAEDALPAGFLIPAGTALMVRKAPNDGSTKVWIPTAK